MSYCKGILILTAIALISLPLASQEVDIKAVKQIDWEEGIVTIDITASSETAWTALSSRYDMDKLISKRAPVLIAETISDIPVNSLNTIGSALRQNTSLYGDLLKLPDLVGKTFSTAAEDRKSLTVQYKIPFFPYIASLFTDRTAADPVPVDLRYTPTTDFTGIVIYAAEDLPLLGTNRKTVLKPSIFPRLYDKDLNVVVDLTKVEPSYLKRWGTAGFSHNENQDYYGDRVGAFPLRTEAIGVFGENKSDLVLSDRSVRQILSSSHNRKILAEGRVVIIYLEP